MASLHEKLKYFCLITDMHLINTEAAALEFATDAGLLPREDEAPPCPKCQAPMRSNKRKESKLGWRWVCSLRNRNNCSGMINPIENTFFEGTKIPIREALVITVYFVLDHSFSYINQQLKLWREKQKLPVIANETIVDFLSYCREVCEIFASHHSRMLGGKGKSILIDETFLTRRKYNRGRVTKNMTIVVLGIYCREDKEGLFFKVKGKSKRHLWPYIKRHVHPETTFIYTDSAPQYKRIENLFPAATHKTTNHKKGVFVDPDDKQNTINDLEGENKLFKRSIKSKRTDDICTQYMAVHYYRRFRLKPFTYDGERLAQFLQDIKAVYPGHGKVGLELKMLDEPTSESEGIEDLMPPKKSARQDDDIPFIQEDDDKWE
ncbi:uncharacterized protein LOC118202738 isoform X2 [Stegodyphus dumicola]|nr:uncharacterized protein LOC118181220 isoform X2 [Stegodyphus dumicola]XP_035206747.1 uncharacterized protein LOC118181673 isoform X2 [Stegodyphus dumicola]XP_035218019.1 uncharacterized protein LOC118191331 isoform X2 [Stegodyphus dumicola]XP_035224142.1 uncharacterized protein LOC118196787 isoform X2 [Stegodyphus dumicola]XP_035230821.1 uncharacterized protein LOC118202738 isoform X2 [Stegodyphus dumicola]